MRILSALLLLIFIVPAHAQDIPLFSQKLTNSFIYNPAIAGQGLGSFTLSYRQNYSGIKGSPESKFLSLHSPFAAHQFGVGVNVFQEEITTLKATYASAAFAYHIRFNPHSTLSFGVSGEYNSIRLSDGLSDVNSGDKVLERYNGGINSPDFSFGSHYQNRFFKVGLAANRLKTGWIDEAAAVNLSNYYSGYVQGVIPVPTAKSLFEPYVAFRKFSETNNTLDIGLFYTYNNRFIAGAASRSGSIINGTLAFKLNKNLLIGYSHEVIMGSVGGYTGSTKEFVLRIDFNDYAQKKRFRADYKNAVTYRRKSIATNKSPGKRNATSAHKAQKKMAPYSPNSRYQNVQKLSQGKKSSMKKRTSSPMKSPKKSSKKKVSSNKKMKKSSKRRR